MTSRAEGLAVMSADAVCLRWFPACNACAAKACLARLLGSCVHAQAGLPWRMRSVRQQATGNCAATGTPGLGSLCATLGTSVQRTLGTHAGQHGAHQPVILQKVTLLNVF